jgi:tRNA-binding protein
VEELVGTQVVACLNLSPRNIAGFMSECLTLGVPDEEGETILLSPTRRVPEGGRLF